MGSEDTHALVGGLLRRCGGEVVASVAKGSTGLLIVGRGEKGENGKPDGKGGRAGLKRRLSFGGCSTAPARLVSLTGRAPCSPGAQPGLPSCQRKHRAASGAGLRCAAPIETLRQDEACPTLKPTGLRPESSSKYAAACRFNASLEDAGEPAGGK